MSRKPLVKVNADQYNTYRDSIKNHPDFFEAHDVGITHGIGCMYVGDTLVAEWDWLFNSVRQRVWEYRIPAESL